jgi:hypothetical protein
VILQFKKPKSSPAYSPSPPWTDGQIITRNSDGTLFIYSASFNALTIKPNVAGINKDAGGFLVVNMPTPVAGTDAANKNYVDSHAGTGGIPDAPADGGTYARESSTWTKTYDGGAY